MATLLVFSICWHSARGTFHLYLRKSTSSRRSISHNDIIRSQWQWLVMSWQWYHQMGIKRRIPQLYGNTNTCITFWNTAISQPLNSWDIDILTLITLLWRPCWCKFINFIRHFLFYFIESISCLRRLPCCILLPRFDDVKDQYNDCNSRER